jgi:hypothetical protein
MILHKFKSTAQEIYLTIAVDLEMQCVMDTWQGSFGLQENFKNGMEAVVKVLAEYGYSKWLADLSNMKGAWDSSREWMLNELLPKAVEAGLRHEAIVLPKDIFAKLSTKDTIIEIDSYECRQFTELEQAKQWLKQV